MGKGVGLGIWPTIFLSFCSWSSATLTLPLFLQVGQPVPLQLGQVRTLKLAILFNFIWCPADGVTRLELVGNDELGNRFLDVVLDEAAERAGAKFLNIA